jgi:flagellar biosynthesis anti-sigma factor FlgM
MKIEDKAFTPDAEMDVKKTRGKDTSKLSPDKSPHTPVPEDRVVLSPKAQQIEEAQRLLRTSPDIREEKVSRLSNEIKNGTYRVDGAKIAPKMTEDALLNEVLLDKTEEQ